jgi:probable rRNA maturation factor
MEVTVNNRQKKIPIKVGEIKARGRKILNALGYPEAELSLVLLDDEEIAELNSRYLGRSGPTNVIAFPMQEGPHIGINSDILGDVVISVETTTAEARENGYTPEEMFDFYLIHGILHLVGYDHTGSVEEAIRMEEKTMEIWTTLGHKTA